MALTVAFLGVFGNSLAVPPVSSLSVLTALYFVCEQSAHEVMAIDAVKL
jgi:hypothetical protein